MSNSIAVRDRHKDKADGTNMALVWLRNDPVSLDDVRQAGVVTALHHIANGDVWPIDEIRARHALLAKKGPVWSVVESVPVHEEIKTHSGDWRRYIANYQQSLRNLAACGIDTVC